MLRPVFVFKVLILSLAINFVFILYLLLRNGNQKLFINRNDDYYDNNHLNSLRDFNPILTNIKVIPMPLFVQTEHSKFVLSDNFRFVANEKPSNYLELALMRYSKYMSTLTKLSIKVDLTSSSTAENTLTIDCTSQNCKNDKYPELGEDESYTLNVTKTGSYLSAITLTGIIRGLSTFVQLIERDKSSDTSFIPCVHIVDRPRFAWRGLLLDMSRHWMPVAVIERTLNAMEMSKMNVLHMHLSDDQGFRVESLVYPLLHDRKDYYSQKDIKHLVKYAEERRIRLIPEFDVPGHTTSWFVGYPDLATVSGQYQVDTRWGMLKATMDPTKESTFKFLDRFLQEMTQLFPDPYFHIGGDEVEGSQWAQSPSIQKYIQEHNLRDKNGLQAYFNRRVQTMLKKNNKIMIGWEEILDEIGEHSGIDKKAIIQSWKSRRSLTFTINNGYRGLLSTGYYLDHLSSSTFHYRNDPIYNDELWLFSKEQRSHILGGEACLWSEYVSQDTVDSRLWPRLFVIAERFWSSSSLNETTSVYERMFRMNHLLDNMQIGVTHLSLYKTRLENLLLDQSKKRDLLHPFMILADVCEPGGFEPRAQSQKYSALVPLTTFIDALQAESELIWKLETSPIDNNVLHDMFKKWSLNHIRLQALFTDPEISKSKQIWGQDIEQLSKNLAHVGRIGISVLNYGSKRILHHDKNHTMNTWPLMTWIQHHIQLLDQLENQVLEVRLAAVRPVRRLLNSMKIFI
ncbi:hypothetical protein I4U23_007755 [Adineta vaga]|nr:hypothetical protein I4U23_007755 [Adineta vaga]